MVESGLVEIVLDEFMLDRNLVVGRKYRCGCELMRKLRKKKSWSCWRGNVLWPSGQLPAEPRALVGSK